MNPYEWGDYFLLVSLGMDRTILSVLCDHSNQEEVLEFITRHVTPYPAIIGVISLTEETFDLLRPNYEQIGRLVEGG